MSSTLIEPALSGQAAVPKDRSGGLGINRCRAASNDRSWAVELTLPAMAYLVVSGMLFGFTRHYVNFDGVCYIENAIRMAAGDWWGSVSGYWSPGISLLIAGLTRMGMDPLDAGHLAQTLCGLLFLVSVSWLLRTTTSLPWGANQAVLLLTALFAVSETFHSISPDILAAAILLQYFAASHSQRSPINGRRAFLAGAIAGLAYLTKYFSLPLFAVHWTCLSIVRFLGSTDRRGRCLAISLSGWLGFAVIAAPWIAVLSARCQRLTFSIQTPYAMYLGGPNGETIRPLDAVSSPAPGRLTVWETPDALTYDRWNPLAGFSELKIHLFRSFKRVRLLISQLCMVDSLCSFPSLLVVLALLACRANDKELLSQLLNVLLFVGICGAGYCAIYLNEYDCRRYVFSLAFPLHLVAVAGASWKLGWFAPLKPGRDSISLWSRGILTGVLLMAFALPSLERTAVHLAMRPPQSFSEAAEALQQWQCAGPVCTTSSRSWLATISPAWRRRMIIAGRLPDDIEFGPAIAELDNASVNTVVVEKDWRHLASLASRPEWEQVGELNICRGAPAFTVFRRCASLMARENGSDALR